MTSTDSPAARAWRRFKKKPLGVFGLLLIVLIGGVALAGPGITPDSSLHANTMNLALAARKPGFSILEVQIKNESAIPAFSAEIKNDSIFIDTYPAHERESFSLFQTQFDKDPQKALIQKTYWLGTDRYGRDVLSRMILGARISFAVGLISVLISLLVGVSLGAIAGFYGGRVDTFIMWLINVVWSIPTLLLVITITLALGKGFWQVFIAVGLTMWVEVARVVRGQVLSLKEKEFVEATESLGFTSMRALFGHVLPNIWSPVIVISAANFAAAILIESGLSFLGLGAQPPIPTWGGMIKDHYSYIIVDKAYLAVIPGVAISVLVLSFMFVGNALRDALDVRGTN